MFDKSKLKRLAENCRAQAKQLNYQAREYEREAAQQKFITVAGKSVHIGTD